MKTRHADHEGKFKDGEPEHARLGGLDGGFVTVVSGLVVLDGTEQVGDPALDASNGLLDSVGGFARNCWEFGFEGVGINL